MPIECWSHEEIEEFYENPNLLIAKANELRSQVIHDLFFRAVNRVAMLLKQLVRQPA